MERQVSAARYAADGTCVLASTSDDTSGSIQYSLKLVDDELGCPSECDGGSVGGCGG